MTTLDIILLVCFLPGLIRGLSKGFLEQVIMLAGVVLGVWAAFHFSTFACAWLKPYLDVSEKALTIVSFTLILLAVIVLAFLAAKALTKLVELVLLDWLDKTLGFVFALSVNALFIGICIILFDTLNVKFEFVKPEILESSVVYSALKDLSYLVFPYLKQLFFKS